MPARKAGRMRLSTNGETDVFAEGLMADRILKISRRLVAVDEIFAFVLRGEAAPRSLGAASVLTGCRERTKRYAHEYYQFDPMFQLKQSNSSGEFTKRVVKANHIGKSDYRAVCFEQPKLRQKISFEYGSNETRLICNFYLRSPVGNSGIQALEDVAAVSLPLLLRLAREDADRANLIERLESRLAETYPMLTVRERQVCARTMAGWSAEAIAVDLGVSAGSALTYRRRAYARYEYSSAGEFLERVIN